MTVTQYFSRIYFSRYFYSTFKSSIKSRIKISSSNINYFYSDPYYRKSKFFSQPDFKTSISAFNYSAPARSFSLNFAFALDKNFYDFSWFFFKEKKNFFFKLFKLFLSFKILSISNFLFFLRIYQLVYKHSNKK